MRVLVACALMAALGLLVIENRASAATLTLCQQDIHFSITPPAEDVPADVRAFSGVWLGNWRPSGRCIAWIFETVRRDGAVDLILVLGPMLGYAANAGAAGGSQYFRKQKGKVEAGVLEYQNRDNLNPWVTYRISNPDEMIGKQKFPNGHEENAVLKRQSY
jgi:hypothetical protein